MSKAYILGVDPGIVDTGVVWVSLDEEEKKLGSGAKVWRNVTTQVKNIITVDESFLEEFRVFVGASRPVFIEGYRNRGRNPKQDQAMTTLVQAIHRTVPGSVIVDNTGVKNVVTEATLALLGLATWSVPTNHSDLKSAARIALKGAYQDPELNRLVASAVLAALEGEPWL